jgi:ArsR family transcriptional regulator, arsenate/arsenite/antimonite-responsive transcriptional repressor
LGTHTPAGRRRGSAPAASILNKADQPRIIEGLTVLFHSLSDPNRLKILFMLAEHGELNVSAIGEQLGQSQPAVSHHLTQLKGAGLVEYRREGKFNFYALHPTGLHELVDRLFPVGLARLTLGGVEVSLRRR